MTTAREGALRPRGGASWPIVLIVIAVALTFGGVASNGFTSWDDQLTIHHNPRLNPPTIQSIRHYWTHPAAGLYIPVTYTAWGILALLAMRGVPDESGIWLDPAVFHVASLAVHAAAAGVAFVILRRLLKRDGPALAGALLFALHPVQVEAVAWASGLKDLLAGLLGLVAVWQYVHAVQLRQEHGSQEKRRVVLHHAIATGALVLAMLAKPSAIVVPLIAGTIDLLILQRGWRDVTRTLWPWLVLMVPCALWTRAVQELTVPPDVALWARPLVAADALAFDLYKLLVPVQFAIDYGRTPVSILSSGAAYVTWVVPAGIAIALVVWGRRAPYLRAGALVFVFGVLPVLGLSPFMFQYFSTVADHYLYLAMFGAALALAGALARWGGRFAGIIVAIVLIALAVRSAVQVGVWRDHTTLMVHALSVNPESVAAYNNLGAQQLVQGNLEQAATYFRKTLSIRADELDAMKNLLTILVRQGRYAEAADVLERMMPHLSRTATDEEMEMHQMLLGELRSRSSSVATSPTTQP